MVEVGAVPPPPDIDNIQEFTAAFSDNEQIQNVVESSVARDLVPQHEILTLQGLATGRKKMGKHIVNIQEFFLTMVQSCLAKLGIRIWGPNLLEPVDSLWNEACRLSALREEWLLGEHSRIWISTGPIFKSLTYLRVLITITYILLWLQSSRRRQRKQEEMWKTRSEKWYNALDSV